MRTTVNACSALQRLLTCFVAAAIAAFVGCDKTPTPGAPPVTPEPDVSVVRPERRTIVQEVGQPGVIQPYQQTAMYAKIAGYVEEWNVDIGDRVEAGELLATIYVPELHQHYAEQVAQVKEAAAMVAQSESLRKQAESDLKTADSDVATAEANVGRFQAGVERWRSETDRMARLIRDKVVDPQVLQESREQLRQNEASRDAALSQVRSRESQRAAAEAALEAAIMAVEASKARLESAEASQRRLEALLGYTKITAPYDAIVTARNLNRGDFVTPLTGDPTQSFDSLGVSPAKAVPLYVLSQTEPVLFVIGVPETVADYVKAGTETKISVHALGNAEITAPVTRTSWFVSPGSRTLEAEIDLANVDAKLLPGMYAYGTLKIQRDNVWSLPVEAIFKAGNEVYCYLVQDGKAVRTALQTGPTNGSWTEIRKIKESDSTYGGVWREFHGGEQVVVNDLSDVVNGRPVNVKHQKSSKPSSNSAPAQKDVAAN